MDPYGRSRQSPAVHKALRNPSTEGEERVRERERERERGREGGEKEKERERERERENLMIGDRESLYGTVKITVKSVNPSASVSCSAS